MRTHKMNKTINNVDGRMHSVCCFLSYGGADLYSLLGALLQPLITEDSVSFSLELRGSERSIVTWRPLLLHRWGTQVLR